MLFRSAQEGKLFGPLAFTKTFAMICAYLLGIIVLPTLVYYIFSVRISSKQLRKAANIIMAVAGVALLIISGNGLYLVLPLFAINNLLAHTWKNQNASNIINIGLALLAVLYLLTIEWLPMGTQVGTVGNLLFVLIIIAAILGVLWSLVYYYEKILRWSLANRWKFMTLPILTILFGIVIWIGFDKTFGIPAKVMETAGWKTFRQTSFWQNASNSFPGVGQEFMPTLNEGSFLLMPTSMPHTGIEQNMRYIEILDKRVSDIPEVETVVGKWGRVNSALDPAPVQMFENTISYRPEYILDENGNRKRFKTSRKGEFILQIGRASCRERV